MKKKFGALFSAAGIAMSLFVSQPQPAGAVVSDWYVGPNTHSAGGSCADPDFTTTGANDNLQVQLAVNGAASGDTVHLCAGTYYFTNEVDITIPLTLVGAGVNLTIIDGQDTTRLFNATENLSISYMWMHSANNSGMFTCFGGGYEDGGAVCAEETLVLTHTLFQDNYADDWGGAVAAGELQISNSTFLENSARNHGGAVVTEDLGGAESVIQSSLFDGNRAGDIGGAIFTSSNDLLTVSGSRFISNEAVEYGGAIFSHTLSIPQTRGNVFRKNVAGREGGAIGVFGMNRQAKRLKTLNRFMMNRGGLYSKDLYIR